MAACERGGARRPGVAGRAAAGHRVFRSGRLGGVRMCPLYRSAAGRGLLLRAVQGLREKGARPQSPGGLAGGIPAAARSRQGVDYMLITC